MSNVVTFTKKVKLGKLATSPVIYGGESSRIKMRDTTTYLPGNQRA